ncbi:MAG: right-handed parallel beta-helix repeat-containing protein, partial [Deltaproteobacteria bacterium]|nr:right-handed parallel beta-helix repeat-containing protein [Deltaproteobacteria bacterium]
MVLIANSSPELLNNTITGGTRAGVEINGGSPTLTDNRIADNQASGVLILNDADAELTGNAIEGNSLSGSFAAVEIRDGAQALLQYNRIWLNKGSGVYVHAGAQARLVGTSLLGNGLHGISVADGARGELQANSLWWNAQTGLRLKATQSLSLKGNFVSHNLLGVLSDGQGQVLAQINNLFLENTQDASGLGLTAQDSQMNLNALVHPQFLALTQGLAQVGEMVKRLQQGSSSATLEQLIEKVQSLELISADIYRQGRLNEEAKARLIVTQVRLAIERNDLSAAQTLLTSVPASGREALGWRKLGEGFVAQAAGERSEARAAFNAASRGRPKFLEARLALALAEGDKAAALMKKLSDLDRKGLAEAGYHLGQLMQARGNSAGAAELFGRVLWSDPTVIDPVQLLVEWIEVLSRVGQGARADQVAAALDQARPSDPRPVRALVAMAAQNGQHDIAVKWLRTLAERQPDDTKLKVELAGALVDAKKEREAEVLLEEMFKAKPASRDADALVPLARAWRERDAFRAKDLLNEAIA